MEKIDPENMYLNGGRVSSEDLKNRPCSEVPIR